MSEPRVIKKYPNRRLYDTAVSKYVTLEDVRRLVRDGIPFVVRDAQTDEDLTRGILLQIIAEQEAGKDPIFTTPILTQLIRFYGDAVQGLATDFLQRSLQAFGDQQEQLRRQLQGMMTQDPVGAAADLTKRNLALWRDMQGTMFGNGPREPASGSRTRERASETHTREQAPGTRTREKAAGTRTGQARAKRTKSKNKRAK